MGRYWPPNKYNFSKYLVSAGDWVESYEMDVGDVRRMELAAYAWAFHKKVRVRCERLRRPNKQYRLRVILVSKYRERNFE